MRRSALQGAKHRRCGPPAIISFTETVSCSDPPATSTFISVLVNFPTSSPSAARTHITVLVKVNKHTCEISSQWHLLKLPKHDPWPQLMRGWDARLWIGWGWRWPVLLHQRARGRKIRQEGPRRRGDKQRFVSCNKHVSVLEESRDPIVRFAPRIIAPAFITALCLCDRKRGSGAHEMWAQFLSDSVACSRFKATWVKNVYYFSSYLYSFTMRLTVRWLSLRHIALFII